MRLLSRELGVRRILQILLIALTALLLLSEAARGVVPDRHRVYGVALSAIMLYASLRMAGPVGRTFLLFLVLSFIFPPALLLALMPRRHREARSEIILEPEGQVNLLNASYGSNLVICRSVRLMGSVAISLAREMSKHRRVVLVDWNGDARARLKEIEHRIANPTDIWFGYQGSLGSSYYVTLSELLSYLTGADPSSVLALLRGEGPPVLRDPRIGECEPLISTSSSEGLRMEDALPKLVGVLILDASRLSAKGKNLISLMTLFQCSVYRERDFLVIAPLLSPLTDERVNPRIRDELRWMISSLSGAGCFIVSTRESSAFSDEFDNIFECGDCANPIYRLDDFRICPWTADRGRRRP
ncbi:MAG: hypothetical protein BA066_05715 [Candidatus Korarchaeota archaeon NZ13-K]|nr:MAG: hypothetical protein BA066_05715 [Candidatus Korarchaeota archaeon NZ13-K]